MISDASCSYKRCSQNYISLKKKKRKLVISCKILTGQLNQATNQISHKLFNKSKQFYYTLSRSNFGMYLRCHRMIMNISDRWWHIIKYGYLSENIPIAYSSMVNTKGLKSTALAAIIKGVSVRIGKDLLDFSSVESMCPTMAGLTGSNEQILQKLVNPFISNLLANSMELTNQYLAL